MCGMRLLFRNNLAFSDTIMRCYLNFVSLAYSVTRHYASLFSIYDPELWPQLFFPNVTSLSVNPLRWPLGPYIPELLSFSFSAVEEVTVWMIERSIFQIVMRRTGIIMREEYRKFLKRFLPYLTFTFKGVHLWILKRVRLKKEIN